MVKRIGVLTSGGDCPGLNNVVKQITSEAINRGFIVEGLTEGWGGPIFAATDEARVRDVTCTLGEKEVRRIDRQGGTILMSSRLNPFDYCGEDVSDRVVNFLNDRYYGTITIGGEDTNGISGRLVQKGARIVGVPKTIDNDLCGTDVTLGFDSAKHIVSRALESLRSTAGSHGLTYFVEIMGRRAGHLAYAAADATNAHFLTIPEVEIDMDKLFELLAERKKSLKRKRGYTMDGRRYAIVAVAEGTRIKGIGEIIHGEKDQHGNVYLGGIAAYLSMAYTKETDFESKPLVLGHLQRAGPPSPNDRILGKLFGKKAVDLVAQDFFGRMVSVDGRYIRDIPLEVVIGRMRVLDAQRCYDAENFQPTLRDALYAYVEVPK